MNIFVLDTQPRLAASYHCDRHVAKMVLETAQILSTAHHVTNSVLEQMYRATHTQHPVVTWATSSEENYYWTYELWRYLAEEYETRYYQPHASFKMLAPMLSITPEDLDSTGLSQFALAMPKPYQQTDAVAAYRAYYLDCKIKFATWRTEVPWWVKEHLLRSHNR